MGSQTTYIVRGSLVSLVLLWYNKIIVEIIRKHRRLDAILGALMAILIIGLMATGGYILGRGLKPDTYIVGERIDEIVPKPDPVVVGGESRILMAGTTFWGRRTNKLARVSELGVEYPFSQLATLEREKYDVWVAGLECPITNNGHTDYDEYTLYKFNCDPDYLSEAAKWFDVFGLGNNHTDNRGEAGFLETKQNLDEVGIQYFGSYGYTDGVNNCSVLALPIRVLFDDGVEEERKMPMAFCSAMGVFGIPTEAVFTNIAKYAEVLPTIVMPHMGVEYQPNADNLRTKLYRKMIDYGADMVIADHPHWVQNSEAYMGKLIVYSMGNFMFDQNTSVEVARSAAIDATASFGGSVDFDAWEKLGEDCVSAPETCYNKLVEAGLPKTEVDWSFDYVATTSAGSLIPRLASEAERAAIGERLDWVQTMKGLD